MNNFNRDQFAFIDYIIDFDRVKELTNGNNSTTCSKIVNDYLHFLDLNGDVKNCIFSLNDKMYFIINTLLCNKILIKPRVLKIEKILKENKND